MKKITLVSTLVLLCVAVLATPLFGACIPHPADAAAVYQTTFTLDIAISPTCNVRCDVCTWATSGGGTEITIDPGSIRFTSNDPAIDAISTVALFDLLAQTAVAQGITSGYLPCGATCTGGIATKVYQASCVQRTGTGSSTQFTPCTGTSYCSRSYTFCCPNGGGSPLITLQQTSSATCSSTGAGCQSTCQ